MSVDEFGNLDPPMNSDHAPTAEEQFPEPTPEQLSDAWRWIQCAVEPERPDYASRRDEVVAMIATAFLAQRQLLAALRENRELRKCCNLGGNPLRLDGVHVKCAADPKDEHEIYGGGMRQPDGRIFCELHAHRAMCAEKDARIAELEEDVRLAKQERNQYDSAHKREVVNVIKLSAKLRAVSDALDEKLERVDPGRYGKYRYVREEDFDAFKSRLRAIVEGK